jgi:xanthosine utilization system XapX-like protein
VSDDLENVRREIENTRLALGDKISRLEERIETTKNTTLNPAYHVKTRPWPTLATVMSLGWFVGHRLVTPSKKVIYQSLQNGAPARSRRRLLHKVRSPLVSMIGIIAANVIRSLIRGRSPRPPD